MPRYDYQCILHRCSFEWEVSHSIMEDPLIKCPKCNSQAKRQIGKNIKFETPVDVKWEKDPSDLSEKSYRQFEKAKKKKYRW